MAHSLDRDKHRCRVCFWSRNFERMSFLRYRIGRYWKRELAGEFDE